MIDLNAYDYHLPPEALATEPASPRDTAKLLIYDTQTDSLTVDIFRNVANYLPKDSFMVLNDTKVLPARVILHKEIDTDNRGGGKVEILFLTNEWQDDGPIKGLSDRKIVVGQKLFFTPEEWVEVVDQDEKIFYFQPNVSRARFIELLTIHGVMPLPKYLRATKLSDDELKEEYQSIFAKKPASVAAPTASLHFTEEVLTDLSAKGIEKHFVTLHVGMGTFAPIDEANFANKKLFPEYYEIENTEAEAIKKLKSKRKLIAVGTTATRALESWGGGDELTGKTEIFIYPPHKFKLVDGLITNFHLPKSSLMLLVDALLQEKKAKRSLVELYSYALAQGFRFYSFGDGMLIL